LGKDYVVSSPSRRGLWSEKRAKGRGRKEQRKTGEQEPGKRNSDAKGHIHCQSSRDSVPIGSSVTWR